jgi:hypothetical protein
VASTDHLAPQRDFVEEGRILEGPGRAGGLTRRCGATYMAELGSSPTVVPSLFPAEELQVVA